MSTANHVTLISSDYLQFDFQKNKTRQEINAAQRRIQQLKQPDSQERQILQNQVRREGIDLLIIRSSSYSRMLEFQLEQ